MKRTALSVVLCVCGLAHVAFAQANGSITTCPQVQASKDFDALAEAMSSTTSVIPPLEQRLQELIKQRTIATSDAEIKQKTERMHKLQEQASRNPQENQELADLQSASQRFISKEATEKELTETQNELNEKKALVVCIRHRFSKITTPEQDFKTWMSLTFALLIFAVIAGFYVVLFRDKDAARTIFVSPEGIQFLTLFSIIIAIILFGISDILEGKELAAILGGLSGYILGKFSGAIGTRKEQTEATVTTFQDQLGSIAIQPTATLDSNNNTKQLTAIPNDSAGNQLKDKTGVFKPTWKSDNTSAATVSSSGLITRVGVGTCNVTASFNSITSNSCVVTCQ